MKNIFKQIKQIFVDSKEYFIRCTLMTLIAGLILCVSIGFVVPASAVNDPTVSDQVVIPAGIYKWSDQIDLTIDAYQIPLNFTIQSVTLDLNGEAVVFPERTEFDHITITNQAISYAYLVNGVSQASYYVADSHGWDSTYYSMMSQGFDFPQVRGIGQTIIISSGTSVNSDFASWFFANTTADGYVDPDPEYTISAGYYKARDSWNISGFPATNDSINIRYYNDAINVQAYVESEGIAFLRENDIVEIYYADSAVFTDGWNIDGAKNIEVLQDISVDSDFYTVFNNIFESSSQGTNEFESGYASGYADGFSAGRDAGYTQGYYEGMAESSGNFFTDILGGVLGSLDAFTIFGGFSLLDLLTTLLGGMALIWILKLLAGG